MNYFKLKYKHSFPIPENIKVTEGITYKNRYGDLAEYILYKDCPVEEQLKNIIPAKYQKHFGVNLAILSTKVTLPHVDECRIAINFYMQTASAITSYYRVKDTSITKEFFRDTKAKVWEYDELEYIDSFTAKVGEIWVLDTRVPHGVICTTTEPRIAYTLRTDDLNFAAIMHILEDAIIDNDATPFEDMPL